MSKLSGIVLLLLAMVLPVTAADYYVSTTGSDTAAGTQAAPWKTVGKINGRALAAGDRVFFNGGQTFADAGLVLGTGDGGYAINRVVVGSYGTGRAIIKPPSTMHGCDIYNVAGITIQNLIFEGTGITTSPKFGLQLYCDLGGGVRPSGVTVTNCEFRQFWEGVSIGAWNASYSGFQDVLIDTCSIHDCRRNGLATYGYSPNSATLQSHRNITVRDCEVYGITGDPGTTSSHSGSGIILSGMIGGMVDRCYAHNNGGSGGNSSGGGPVGIWTYASDSVTIQRSLVHDQKTKAGVMDGGGFDIDGGSTNAVVQYCYSYNNEGAGYLVAEYAGATPLTNGTIRYNISWKDGRRQGNNMGSLHFWNDNSNPAGNCAGIKAYNNVLYTDGSVGGPAIRYQSGPMTGHSIRNNVVIVTGGAKLVDIGSNTGAFTITGNSYFATDGNYAGGWAWNGATSTSLAAWRTTTGTPETVSGSPTGLQGDPLLVSPVAGAQPTAATALEAITAFRLQSSSPLINAGLNLTTSTFGSLVVGSRDFFNQPIPVGAYDIGAYEAPASGTAPAITTQPANMTVTAPATATCTVAASGSPAPTFQWSSAPSGSSTFTAISGATSATYTTGATSTGMTGTQYRCVATNSAGSATSNVATLSVTSGSSTGTGTGLTGTYFNDMTLTNSVLTRTDAQVGFDWGTGSPHVALPVDGFSTRWTGTVQAQYTETYTFFTMSDDGVRLWVNGQPLVNNWTNHAPTEDSGSIALTAGVQYAITMEFYENGGGAVAQLRWSSPSTVKTLIPQSQLYSTAVILVAPAITSQPANATVTSGAIASFTVTASGTPAPTIQWQRLISTTWTNISGATSATYNVTTVLGDNGAQFRAVSTNSAGIATSNVATLTVTAASVAPAITTQPVNATVTAPTTATFTVAVSGSPASTFQWSSAPSSSSTFTAISGATSASYTTGATSTGMTGTQYRCLASNSAGSATSNVASVTISTWSTRDIGAVAATGSSALSGGIWTLVGSGADIWDAADEFRYTSQAVSGDVVITARVTGLQNTNTWAKAGVMVRETIGDTSRHAFTCLTPGNGAAFQRRLTTAGSSLTAVGPAMVAPGWVRMERVGNVFISSVSTTGTTWTEISRETITMAAAVQVGLAVTSHADGTLCTATLSDVTVVSAPTAVN